MKHSITIALCIAFPYMISATHQSEQQCIANHFASDSNTYRVSKKVYDYFQNLIDREEQESWRLIEQNTGVTKSRCLKEICREYKRYQKSLRKNWQKKLVQYPPLTQATIALVQNTLKDFSIDPSTIQIIPLGGLGGAPAAADDGTIFVDETELSRYSPSAQKFCIAHEIAHLKAHDHSTIRCLCFLTTVEERPAKTMKKKKAAIKAAVNTFKRFQEIRADTNALLHGGQEYVQGAYEVMNTLHTLDGGDNLGITHPKTSERKEVLDKLCTMMGWNSQQPGSEQ
jgi:hypothetical protein